MAETCIINIGDLPGRRLRRKVRVFMQGEEVSVEDAAGRRYGVAIRRNKLILRSDDGDICAS
ncbi:MAG: hypothetical protein JSW05_08815 [Candidatus Thorarchaeota archaeon]|nr:MAG: hypothetical protein JSW05_08815 [Candidatus Thorarchaeota archaeon]